MVLGLLDISRGTETCAAGPSNSARARERSRLKWILSLSRLFDGIKSDSRETGSDHFLSSLSFGSRHLRVLRTALFSFDELHELLTKRMETIYDVLLYPSLRIVTRDLVIETGPRAGS